jgi:hypothetical protein
MTNYAHIQASLAQGWNTWDTRSVLTHVLLPDALGLSLGLKEYYRGTSLRAAQIGRRTEGAESVTLGRHAYDGRYTETTVTWAGVTIRVETAHAGADLVVLVTPTANQRKSALLTTGVGYLWNRPGSVTRDGAGSPPKDPAGPSRSSAPPRTSTTPTPTSTGRTWRWS